MSAGTGEAANVVGLYALGLVVVGVGGVLVPLVPGSTRSSTEGVPANRTDVAEQVTGSEPADGSGTDDDPTSQATFELYEDRGGEWRWRLRHRNGNIIADSGEGYSSRSTARNAVDGVKRNAATADVSTD